MDRRQKILAVEKQKQIEYKKMLAVQKAEYQKRVRQQMYKNAEQTAKGLEGSSSGGPGPSGPGPSDQPKKQQVSGRFVNIVIAPEIARIVESDFRFHRLSRFQSAFRDET